MTERFIHGGKPGSVPGFLTGDAYVNTLELKQAHEEIIRLRARLQALEANDAIRKQVMSDAIRETQAYKKRIDELEAQLGGKQ
jgi:hypothetical protein